MYRTNRILANKGTMWQPTGVQVIQLSDDSPVEVVPSAIEKPFPNNHNEDLREGFLPLRQPTSKSYKPYIHPETGRLICESLSTETLAELIKDPEHDGKAVIIGHQDQPDCEAMCLGPARSYREEIQFELKSGNFGKGGYGNAQWIKDRHTQTHLIKKEIKKDNFKPKEIVALLRLKGNLFFPSLHGFMSHGSSVSIFMEYGGFSFNKVVANPQFRSMLNFDENILNIARQGFEALDFLAAAGLIHMDIKPENLCLRLCDGVLQLMICDFGSCHKGPVVDKVVMSGWTTAYMAPEMCRFVLSTRRGYESLWKAEQKEVNNQVDVYAFCAALLYLLYWKHWQALLIPEGKRQTAVYLQSEIATNPSALQALINPEWDKRLQDVLRGGLCDRTERITPREALEILNAVPVGKEVNGGTRVAESVPMSDLSASTARASASVTRPNVNTSRKRRSGGGEKDGSSLPKVKALQIDPEPPEMRNFDGVQPMGTDSETSPGATNLPNLDLLFN